ncbi:MAG TPA: type II secretion system major pseudopilin GspG [Fimbriimonas sp.]|nr:type II secretion system major pseudopilin GspG [Fimbriimonas sp.]
MNRKSTSLSGGASPLRKGFTLIELMVVILILAILAALIVPRVIGRQDEAKVAAAKSDEAALDGALNTFRLHCDRYPTTEEGLSALQTMPPGLDGKWKGPYLDKPIGQDPWQHDYVYQSPGQSGGSDSYTITSYGKDGVAGGTGTDQDIIDDHAGQ